MKNRYSIVVLALCMLFIVPVFADSPYIDDAYYWDDGRHVHVESTTPVQTAQATPTESASTSENQSSAQETPAPVDIQYVNVQDTTITVKINR
jgi:hypothetical protein